MTAYAKKRGYQAQRLSWWRKRLGDERAGAASTGAPLALAPAVITSGQVPVVVSIEAQAVRVEVDEAMAVPASWIADVAAALQGGGTR